MTAFPVEYSTLSASALLQLVMDNYEITAGAAIIYLKRGFNDTYLISNGNVKYILRVYKSQWRSKESIETELALLTYLKENGLSVSYPIKDKRDSCIQPITAPEGQRYAVLFSYAEGALVRKLSVEQAFLLGIETGKLHRLTQDQSFGGTAQNYSLTVQFKTTLTTLKQVLAEYPEHYNYLQKLQEEFILAFKDKELATGICHGDLQAENFHLTPDNKFTFFDFDFFGTGHLAYDIGVFKWYDHKNKTPQIMNAFLNGYETQRKLSEAEKSLIPYFSALRALFQMTLYCSISNGKQLPLWPAKEVAAFVDKIKKWMLEETGNNIRT